MGIAATLDQFIMRLPFQTSITLFSVSLCFNTICVAISFQMNRFPFVWASIHNWIIGPLDFSLFVHVKRNYEFFLPNKEKSKPFECYLIYIYIYIYLHHKQEFFTDLRRDIACVEVLLHFITAVFFGNFNPFWKHKRYHRLNLHNDTNPFFLITDQLSPCKSAIVWVDRISEREVKRRSKLRKRKGTNFFRDPISRTSYCVLYIMYYM